MAEVYTDFTVLPISKLDEFRLLGREIQGFQAETAAKPLISRLPAPLKSLRRPRSRKEMRHKRDDREQQQQMNQAASYMEHQKAACPENQQQQSKEKKRSRSHFRLLQGL